jgi:hypothetical protein
MWFSLIKLELRMSFRLWDSPDSWPNSFNQQAYKKHYSAFDGDAAGLRASVRVDLILEEGMNVKVLSLMEKTDSFAKKISWWFSGLSGR